jgi:hypothetical protein
MCAVFWGPQYPPLLLRTRLYNWKEFLSCMHMVRIISQPYCCVFRALQIDFCTKKFTTTFFILGSQSVPCNTPANSKPEGEKQKK